jgi:hypothetical protein
LKEATDERYRLGRDMYAVGTRYVRDWDAICTQAEFVTLEYKHHTEGKKWPNYHLLTNASN